MRLADFIQNKLEAILQEWEDFARAIEPIGAGMSSKQLRDHASAMLMRVSEDLRRSQTPEQQVKKAKGGAAPNPEDEAAGEHGIARLEAEFTIEQLASEYRALRASVLRLWSDSNKSPLSTDLEDVTRFNEAIDQLLMASITSFARKSRNAIEVERRHRDEFLAMLAHELRNPLAPLRSASQLLKRVPGDTAVASKTSSIIERQVEHMTVLIDDLLDVSRVTRGLIELEQAPVAIDDVVNDAVEQVTPLVQARRQQLAVQAAPEPAIVSGDRNRLVQITANLLTNAAKYSRDEGHILLKTEADNDRVTLTVQDDGEGMTPDLIEHLFEPFVQAKRSADRASGGLGLGLTLVKRLVELHRGTVSCSSAGLGKGSTFSVCLPRLAAHGADIERARADREHRGGAPHGAAAPDKPLKVLVVDDNVDAAQALSIMLESFGHRVMVEHEGSRALDRARSDLPDVCVLDIGLPGMDGNELARRLRAHAQTAKTRLIALTGYGQPRDREQALASGFDYHLTKPVDGEKLLALLDGRPGDQGA